MCGVGMQPNPTNMCVSCVRSKYDITEGIPKQLTVLFCRECERYLQPPAHWVTAALESKELLALCLKRIRGLGSKVKLVDAAFVWTEPHSRRIKCKFYIMLNKMGNKAKPPFMKTRERENGEWAETEAETERKSSKLYSLPQPRSCSRSRKPT